MSNKPQPIETKIGTLYAHAVNGDRVYVDCHKDYKTQPPVVIRGREYYIAAGVTLLPDGTLKADYTQYRDIYINRVGDYSSFPTHGPTIIAAARAAILDAARKFLDANPDALAVAGREQWNMDLLRAERKVKEAQAALADAESALLAVWDREP